MSQVIIQLVEVTLIHEEYVGDIVLYLPSSGCYVRLVAVSLVNDALVNES